MNNILVVDDDREIVESISIFLQAEGYNVIKAYDGLEALDKALTGEVHFMTKKGNKFFNLLLLLFLFINKYKWYVEL